MREKRPLRLAVEGALAGTFMAAVVTRGDFPAAWQVGIFFGIVCGLIGLYAGAASPPDSSTVSSVAQ